MTHDVRTMCSRCGDWYWAGDAHTCSTRGLEIPLTQGFVALVDEEDYDRVTAAGKWYAHVKGPSVYAQRRAPEGGERKIRLHTFLTGWPLVDHINLDGLDNRRVNLRPATTAENLRNVGPRRTNTSGFKGVTRGRHGRGWVAQIRFNGQNIRLGTHSTREEAARAYDAAARELHGEFARLNFPAVSA